MGMICLPAIAATVRWVWSDAGVGCPKACDAGWDTPLRDWISARRGRRRVTRLFNGAGLDGDERLVHYFRWISESRLQALYTPAFRARLGNAHAMTPMLEFLQPLSAQAEPLERMPALEQRFFLADHNLIYTDKMSMAVGVELRAACSVHCVQRRLR